MVDKNHVRALVHSTGRTMTWAINYYKAYRFELSQALADDMIIDDVIDLEARQARVTFLDVLQAILDAANAGYSEILIVAHGSPKGLSMHMAPGLDNADKDGLPFMTQLAGVAAERDRIRAIVDPQQQLSEWLKLLKSLAGKPFGSTTWGMITPAEFDQIQSAADAEKKLVDTAPIVKGQNALRNANVLKLLGLRNQVVNKRLKRVEVRACNLGQDKDGLKALREFLGVARVLAPMVKTFYGHVSPTLFTKEAEYRKWLATFVPWLARGQPDPPLQRAYVGPKMLRRWDDKYATPLAVLWLRQPHDQRCAASASDQGDYFAVKDLVNDNIGVKGRSGYSAGLFFIGGLDPYEGRTKDNPPPPSAKGKAFLLPSEPEYRQMIVSDP